MSVTYFAAFGTYCTIANMASRLLDWWEGRRRSVWASHVTERRGQNRAVSHTIDCMVVDALPWNHQVKYLTALMDLYRPHQCSWLYGGRRYVLLLSNHLFHWTLPQPSTKGHQCNSVISSIIGCVNDKRDDASCRFKVFHNMMYDAK